MRLQISLSKLLLVDVFDRIAPVATADPVETWRSLNATHHVVRGALDAELRREHDISAVEFEVLERIAACPDACARMQDIAAFAHLTQSTASRVVARLEDEGLATRTTCPDDRRGIFAKVTAAGRERVAAAAPTYRRVITDTLRAA
jgi:DNA-binding MarR family transcriptional regulator